MKKPLLICSIDDDEIYQFTLKRIIKKHHLTENIISFPDGEKAIQFLTKNITNAEKIPDIIFLDNNMPIMDGWQFIKEYANIETAIEKKASIYMLSSSVDPVDIKRAKKISQISDYLQKPIRADKIKGIIEARENS